MSSSLLLLLLLLAATCHAANHVDNVIKYLNKNGTQDSELARIATTASATAATYTWMAAITTSAQVYAGPGVIVARYWVLAHYLLVPVSTATPPVYTDLVYSSALDAAATLLQSGTPAKKHSIREVVNNADALLVPSATKHSIAMIRVCPSFLVSEVITTRPIASADYPPGRSAKFINFVANAATSPTTIPMKEATKMVGETCECELSLTPTTDWTPVIHICLAENVLIYNDPTTILTNKYSVVLVQNTALAYVLGGFNVLSSSTKGEVYVDISEENTFIAASIATHPDTLAP